MAKQTGFDKIIEDVDKQFDKLEATPLGFNKKSLEKTSHEF